jgi:hypothetical protein
MVKGAISAEMTRVTQLDARVGEASELLGVDRPYAPAARIGINLGRAVTQGVAASTLDLSRSGH